MAAKWNKIASVSNANLFSAAGDGLSKLINDTTPWACTTVSANLSFSFTATLGGRVMYFKFTRLAVNSPSFTVSISENAGATWTRALTCRLSSATTFTGNIAVFSLIDTKAVRLVLETSSDGVYSYKLIYCGSLDSFESATADINAWGHYVSGAPEAEGDLFLNRGIPTTTRELFFIRSIEKDSGTTLTNEPYHFMDMQGWGDGQFGYNGVGEKDNALAGSASWNGSSLRDIFEEEKFLVNRIARIGVYKEYTGDKGRGMRGTLSRIYSVHATYHRDSAGVKVPHTAGNRQIDATIRIPSIGNVTAFNGATDWWIFVLDNEVTRYDIFSGLHIIAIPKVDE